MYSGGQKISLGNRTQSRQVHPLEGSSPARAKASGMGHHRDLRSGHVFRGVIRELGRTSRLLGNNSRSRGDRRNQHPGDCRTTRTANEPSPAQAGRDTQKSASTQGIDQQAFLTDPPTALFFRGQQGRFWSLYGELLRLDVLAWPFGLSIPPFLPTLRGPRQLPMGKRWAARVAQFGRSGSAVGGEVFLTADHPAEYADSFRVFCVVRGYRSGRRIAAGPHGKSGQI